MPIYEFRCLECNETFETLVRRREEQLICPSCQSEQLQKLISAHSVGSGIPDTACGSAPCMPALACGSGGCVACE